MGDFCGGSRWSLASPANRAAQFHCDDNTQAVKDGLSLSFRLHGRSLPACLVFPPFTCGWHSVTASTAPGKRLSP